MIVEREIEIKCTPKGDIFAQTNVIPSGLDDGSHNFYNPDIPSGLFPRNPK